MSANQWAELISSVVYKKGVDKVPDCYKTTTQLCEDQNLSERAIRKRLATLISMGKVETKQFRIKTPARESMLITHYKIK